MSSPVQRINHVQAFYTFINIGGDLPKVALALNVDLASLQSIALTENWEQEYKKLKEAAGDDVGDHHLKVNRVINYVQAHRLRLITDSVISHLATLKPEDLIILLTTSGPNGSSFSVRPITDLAKSAEVAQLLTYRALGDSVAQKTEDGDASSKSKKIVLDVGRAMAAAEDLGLDSMAVVQKALAAPLPTAAAPAA